MWPEEEVQISLFQLASFWLLDWDTSFRLNTHNEGRNWNILIIALLTVAYISLWESCCHLGAQNSRYHSTKQHWPRELTSSFNVFLSEQRRRLSGELGCSIKGGNEAWGFIFKKTPSPSAVQTPLFACVSRECLWFVISLPWFFLHDTEALQKH